MSAVTLSGVRKSFGRTEVIKGVDLEIEDGEFVVFVGPSGCGKSTLLRLIAGLDEVSGGDLIFGGERVTDWPPAKRGVGMVFQSYALYPHMTAYQNMAFGMSLRRASRDEIDAKVRAAAETLELTELLERLPKELSGGQRQRVAIGRAIVREPAVFLFDEPLSNLDAALRTQMRAEIARLHDRLKATIVYVTHDQVEAMTLGDRIVVLNQGRIEQVGAPLELYETPATQFVAGFIGAPQMNFLEVRVEGVESGAARLTLPGGETLTAPVVEGAALSGGATLGVRPERIAFTDAGGMPATVDLVENMGDSHLLHMSGPEGARIVAKLPGAASVKEGEDRRIAIEPDACHLFDAEGRAVSAPA